MWVEAWVPEGNSHKDRENMQTQHSGIKPGTVLLGDDSVNHYTAVFSLNIKPSLWSKTEFVLWAAAGGIIRKCWAWNFKIYLNGSWCADDQPQAVKIKADCWVLWKSQPANRGFEPLNCTLYRCQEGVRRLQIPTTTLPASASQTFTDLCWQSLSTWTSFCTENDQEPSFVRDISKISKSSF